MWKRDAIMSINIGTITQTAIGEGIPLPLQYFAKNRGIPWVWNHYPPKNWPLKLIRMA